MRSALAQPQACNQVQDSVVALGCLGEVMVAVSVAVLLVDPVLLHATNVEGPTIMLVIAKRKL